MLGTKLVATALFAILFLINFTNSTHLLEGRSFKFKSIISNNFDENSGQVQDELKPVLRLTEEYSAEQGRANVYFTQLRDGNYTSGLFQLDRERAISILFFEQSSGCRQINSSQFNQLLFATDNILGTPQGEEFLDSELSGTFGSESNRLYQLASAELLYSILDNLDKFETCRDESGNNQTEFRFYNEDLKTHVAALFPDSLATGIPSSVLIEFANNKLFAFRYYDFEFLHPEASSTPAFEKVDSFALKLTRECFDALHSDQTPPKSERLFEFNHTELVRSSFRAQIKHYNHQLPVIKTSLIVAYDAELNSMRIDNLHTLQPNIGKTLRRQVFNFKEGKNYFLLEAGPQKSNCCLVTRFLWSLLSELRSQRIGELLSGSGEFLYLGKATLRGQRVKMYKAFGGSLPFWLEQRVDIFSNATDKIRFLLPERGLIPGSDKNTSIVIYVRHDSRGLPVPVQIELTRPNVQNRSMYDNYLVRLFDFQWQWEPEAPNGDKAVSIFSLQNLCHLNGEKEFDKPIKVKMLLDSENVDSSRELLQSTKRRNLALLNSVQNDLPLNVNMIYNLNSKLLVSEDSNWFKLYVEFSAAEHTNILSEIISIGRGSLEDDQIVRAFQRIDFVGSLQECHLLASAGTTQTGSAFGYDHFLRKCFIQTNNTGQQLYTLHDEGEVEFYRIELRLDKDRNMERLQRFANETLPLIPQQELTLRDSSFPGVELKLKLREFQLRAKESYSRNFEPKKAEKFLNLTIIVASIFAIALALLLITKLVGGNRLKRKLYFNSNGQKGHLPETTSGVVELRNIRRVFNELYYPQKYIISRTSNNET